MFQPSRVILAVILIGFWIVTVKHYLFAPDQADSAAVFKESGSTLATVAAEPVEQVNFEPRSQTLSNPQIWRVMTNEESAAIELIGARRDVVEKTMVKLDLSSVKDSLPGDRFQLVLPQLSELIEVEVTQKQVLASGNLSITGKVSDHPLLDFAMTMSENATLATIGTEQGVYSLRGNNRHAWVARSREYNHHVDPNTPDYRLPRSTKNEQSTKNEKTNKNS